MKSVLLLSVFLLSACGGSNQSKPDPSCSDQHSVSCLYEDQYFKYEGPNHLGLQLVGRPEFFIKRGDYIASFEFETGDISPDGRLSFFTFGAPSETRIQVETTDPYMSTYNIRMQLFDGSYSEWVEILVEI